LIDDTPALNAMRPFSPGSVPLAGAAASSTTPSVAAVLPMIFRVSLNMRRR
jgi:hypothetical protein